LRHMRYDQVGLQDVAEPGAEGVQVRWLISAQDGAPSFCMRRFELAPGGHTPRHKHAWEHEVYILEGKGTVFCGGREEAFAPGDVIYVAPDEEHSFAAGRRAGAAFLCIVPRQAAGRR